MQADLHALRKPGAHHFDLLSVPLLKHIVDEQLVVDLLPQYVQI